MKNIKTFEKFLNEEEVDKRNSDEIEDSEPKLDDESPITLPNWNKY